MTISVACFIPKPFTPFQWEAQNTREELARKQRLLGEHITDNRIRYTFHDSRISHIEAVLARGDRRLSAAILEAYRRGSCFDAWDEHFDYDRWLSVFADTGIDVAFYANREFGEDEVLPWDIIDCGVKGFLICERRRAYEASLPKLPRRCLGCSANSLGGKGRCCP